MDALSLKCMYTAWLIFKNGLTFLYIGKYSVFAKFMLLAYHSETVSLILKAVLHPISAMQSIQKWLFAL